MAITYIKKRRTPGSEVVSRNVLDYGEIDLSGAVACDDILNQAFRHAAQHNNVEIALPRGIYRLSGPVSWPGQFPRIRGTGGVTVLLADSTEFRALTVGPGADIGFPIPGGWVRDLIFQCAAEVSSPAGTTAALVNDGALFTEFRNLSFHFFPIAHDIINNGYGSVYYNIRTFFGECRIGLLLRGESPGVDVGAGSDITFYNSWIHGGECAVYLGGNQGNYHFDHGQLAGGFNMTPSDLRGVITAGLSFTTGLPVGSCGITLRGTSFERIHNGWAYRGFGTGTSPAGLSFIADSKTRFTPGTGAIGIGKITNGFNDRVNLDFPEVAPDTAEGPGWSSAEPWVYASPAVPGAARPFFAERGTQGISTFGGVSRDLNSDTLLNFSPTVPYIRAQSAFFDHNTGRTVFWTSEGLVATDERGQVGYTDKFNIIPA